MRARPLLIERYRDRLSLEPGDPVVSLNEGSTPLIEAPRLSERIGARAYLKFEGANPTGCFKDRGMTVAVSRAEGAGGGGGDLRLDRQHGGQRRRLRGAGRAARGGDRPRGQDRDRQARPGADARRPGDRAAGATSTTRCGSSASWPTSTRSSSSTRSTRYRIEGQKTAAFEVVEELGEAPGALAIPVGNAGNVTAYWRGFQERGAAPVLYGFQAEGAAPLVRGAPVAEPETVASAIRIGNPARWEEAMDAFTASRGRVAAVSDEQILDAYRWLAASEGVFCEPASAASVAGLLAHGLPVVEARPPPGVGRLRAHRPRPQGPRHGPLQSPAGDQLRERPQRRRAGGVRLTARRRLVRVPASSANLGPGYDVMAAAVSLLLELEVEETGEFSLRPGRARRARPGATT